MSDAMAIVVVILRLSFRYFVPSPIRHACAAACPANASSLSATRSFMTSAARCRYDGARRIFPLTPDLPRQEARYIAGVASERACRPQPCQRLPAAGGSMRRAGGADTVCRADGDARHAQARLWEKVEIASAAYAAVLPPATREAKSGAPAYSAPLVACHPCCQRCRGRRRHFML